MNAHLGRSQRPRSPLLFLFLAVFIDLIGYGIVLPLLPFYIQQYGASASLVGAIGSLYAGLQFISGPVLGGLGDRYGRRPILLFCLFGTALAYLLLGLATTLSLLLLAIVLDGLTGANLATAQAYIADSTGPDERARGMGILGAAFGLGMICGPALGGLLSLHSLHTPALVAAAIAFANVGFGLLALPESLPPERRTHQPLMLNPMRYLTHVFQITNVRGLLATIFALNLAFAGLQSNFPVFSAVRFGWNATTNALFYAFVGLCAVLTQGVLLRSMQPRLGEQRMVLIGITLMAINLALMALTSVGWLLFPIVGLIALGSGLAIPALSSLLSQRAAPHQQGQIMGGQQAVLSLTMLCGPSIAGVAFDTIGVGAPYWLGSLFAAFALVLAWGTLTARSANPVLEERHGLTDAILRPEVLSQEVSTATNGEVGD